MISFRAGYEIALVTFQKKTILTWEKCQLEILISKE